MNGQKLHDQNSWTTSNEFNRIRNQWPLFVYSDQGQW